VNGIISLKKQYSKEFKIEAVRRVESSGESVLKIASDLGVKSTTLHGWIKQHKQALETSFPSSIHLKPEDGKLRNLDN